MKLSSYNMFLADLYSKGLEYACKRAATLGFEGVELLDFCPWRRKATYEMYSVEEYLNEFEKNGLSLACYSSAALLCVDDEESLLKEIFKQADFTAALGGKLFHHTFTIELPKEKASLSYSEMLERVVPVAKKIADHCAKLGVTCLYEPQGKYFNGIEGLGGLYREMEKHCENIGICCDVGNPLFVEEIPEAVVAKFAKQTKHVHIKDYLRYDEPLPNVKLIQKSRDGKYLYDCNVGDGIIDLGACFDSLKAVGYDGYVSFELVGDDEFAKNGINYIKTTVR